MPTDHANTSHGLDETKRQTRLSTSDKPPRRNPAGVRPTPLQNSAAERLPPNGRQPCKDRLSGGTKPSRARSFRFADAPKARQDRLGMQLKGTSIDPFQPFDPRTSSSTSDIIPPGIILRRILYHKSTKHTASGEQPKQERRPRRPGCLDVWVFGCLDSPQERRDVPSRQVDRQQPCQDRTRTKNRHPARCTQSPNVTKTSVASPSNLPDLGGR